MTKEEWYEKYLAIHDDVRGYVHDVPVAYIVSLLQEQGSDAVPQDLMDHYLVSKFREDGEPRMVFDMWDELVEQKHLVTLFLFIRSIWIDAKTQPECVTRPSWHRLDFLINEAPQALGIRLVSSAPGRPPEPEKTY